MMTTSMATVRKRLVLMVVNAMVTPLFFQTGVKMAVRMPVPCTAGIAIAEDTRLIVGPTERLGKSCWCKCH